MLPKADIRERRKSGCCRPNAVIRKLKEITSIASPNTRHSSSRKLSPNTVVNNFNSVLKYSK